jgi:disulfide bond formation protein DsbB
MGTPDAGATTTSLEQTISLSRYGALLVAGVATGGSLFFSDIIGWLPCVLCWYQRILMYPLVLVLAVGILRRDYALHFYVLPLSLLGMGTALYHYLLVRTDLFPEPPCSVGIPCTVEYLNLFGFLNIPMLALIAFTLISVAMAINSLHPAAAAPATEEAAAPASRWGPALAVAGILIFLVLAYIVGAALW